MLNRYNTLAPNVVRGGTAIPLGNNFYYMKGRKHKNGGIDIGENPKTGLEVEGGEVMEMRPNEVRVYSSVPFLQGVSPAKLVLGGANPNAVFNAQEQYKDRNKLNDDGTKKAKYGIEKNNNELNITLPEIVVKPSEYQNYYMENIRPKDMPKGEYFLRGIIPEFRINKLTKEEQDNKLKRLIDIYEYAGKPTVNYNGLINTAYYMHLNNSINSIKDANDLIAELAHPIQRKIGKNDNFIKDGIINTINKIIGKNTHYIDKNNFEYETHRVIEPKLRNYLLNPNIKNNLTQHLQMKYGGRKQAELGILDELNNYYNIAKHNINAGINYIKRKFSDEEEKPNAAIIRLNNKKVSRITPTTNNTESILFNDFVENNPNNIRLAKDFKNTNDTLIGDKKIPLNKISYYYGIENNKLKVGNINNFDDETTIIPVRNKNIGKIKKIIVDNVPNDSIDYYKNKISKLSELSSNEKNKIYNKYANDNNIEPSISHYTSLLVGVNPKLVAGREAYIKKYKKHPITKYDEELRYLYNKLNNPISFVTENNDTIDSKIAQMIGGAGGYKMILGDEKGNSYFINRLKDIDKKELDKLNKEIENNPVYPVMVDNGRYSHFYENVDALHNYNTYTANDFYRDPKNIFVVGTKKQYGGNMIASINGNVKNGLIHTEMKCGGRKKALLGKEETLPFIDRKPTRLNVDATPNISKITLPASLQNASRNYSINSSYPLRGVRTEDWISLASNIGSTLAGSLIGANATIKAPDLPEIIAPTLVTPGNLKTYFNINPQLSTVRLNTLARMADIDRNTASSRTALARKQRLANLAVSDINNLYGQKENIETELYNRNVLNKQAVAAQNTQIYNKYLTDKLNRDVEQIKLKYASDAENIRNRAMAYNNLLSGTNASIQDLISRLEQRRKDRNTLTAVAARSKDAAAFLKTLNLFE